MPRCVESHMFCSTATHRIPHSQHAAMSVRVHCACVTRHDALTRHTQHPFSMYRCLRKKVPIGIALLESLRPFPLLFNVGGVKRGVACRLRKKIPFLRGRSCTATFSTLKTGGKGWRTHQQHGVAGTFFRRHRNKTKHASSMFGVTYLSISRNAILA